MIRRQIVYTQVFWTRFLLFLNQEKHIIHAAMYTRGSVLSQASTFYAVVGLVDNRDKVVKESAFVALSQPPQNGLGWANSLRVCVSTGAHKSSNCRGIKRTID
jgi:hypothetical protein